MAKCDLSIELDDPKRVYPGGGTITGVVRVRADADVKCKALEVSSGWKTHGRGNVASGTQATTTLFAGEWNAGLEQEYRFELPIAEWPPSYHGHYLNVDHYVDARAKIPWAFDPKASVPFLMKPSSRAAAEVTHSNVTQVKGVLGTLVAGIFFTVFIGIAGTIIVVSGGCALIPFLFMGAIGFAFWLFKYYLPRYLLGDVQYSLSVETVSPGETVTGELLIQPKKNVVINAITMQFEAREQCVSGSGSNRTTHKNVFYERSVTLQESTTLQAGKQHRFPLLIDFPDDAPYSIDLDDNDLIWCARLRVDIPKWPDWTKEITMTVVPHENPQVGPDQRPSEAVSAPPPLPGPSDTAGITFAETAQRFWEARNHPDQIELLVEAVAGLTFSMEAFVERRLLYGGEDDPHLHEDGYAVWAHAHDPPLPLVMYVPHDMGDEFEQIGRDLWRGRGTVLGWDAAHRRLQINVESNSQTAG